MIKARYLVSDILLVISSLTNPFMSILVTLGIIPWAPAMIRRPRRWNVVTLARCPTSASMRFRRSSTELFVKDRNSISSGLALPDMIRCFASPTIVVVFPVPAPAMTSLLRTSMAMDLSC